MKREREEEDEEPTGHGAPGVPSSAELSAGSPRTPRTPREGTSGRVRSPAGTEGAIVSLGERQGSLRSKADEMAFIAWVHAQSHDDRMSMLSDYDSFKRAEQRWLATVSPAVRDRLERRPRRHREATALTYRLSMGKAFVAWKQGAGKTSRAPLKEHGLGGPTPTSQCDRRAPQLKRAERQNSFSTFEASCAQVAGSSPIFAKQGASQEAAFAGCSEAAVDLRAH